MTSKKQKIGFRHWKDEFDRLYKRHISQETRRYIKDCTNKEYKIAREDIENLLELKTNDG